VVNFHFQTHLAPKCVVIWNFDFQDLLKNVLQTVKAFRHVQSLALSGTVDRRTSFGLIFNGGLRLGIRGAFLGTIDEFHQFSRLMLDGLPQPSKKEIQQVDWMEGLCRLAGANSCEDLKFSRRRVDYQEHSNFFANSVTIPDALSEETLIQYFQYVLNKGVKSPTGW
jgi:hypothetical protein